MTHPHPAVDAADRGGRDAFRFRPDVEGLRALAIGLVVAYHAGFGWASGGYVGVDVFFVVSGFLITGLLVAERRGTGRISMAGFYARRIRRVLPASACVLVLTVLVVRRFAPPLAAEGLRGQAVSAALYVSNMIFARQGTSYLTAARPSLVQHYWSLSAEEQFYLFWPLLIVAVSWAAARLRRSLLPFVATIGVASFVLCVALTRSAQPWAFFLLPARAWELSVGGAVALLLPRLSDMDARVAAVVAWAGLVAVVVAGHFYDASTAFPGTAALLPVLGTAAVIAGCTPRSAFGPEHILARRPVLTVGRLSYSMYLWHWPVFLAATAGGTTTLSIGTRVALIVVTVALSYVTYRFVENPARTSRRLLASNARALAFGGVLTLIAVGAALTVRVPAHIGARGSAVAASDEVPGDLHPSLNSASMDLPLLYLNGCHAEFLTVEPKACTFGDVNGSRTIALMGDSHAAQWFPPLELLSRAHHWRLVTFTKSACPPYDVVVPNLVLRRRYTECEVWRDRSIRRMHEMGVSLVVMSSSHEYPLPGGSASFDATWTQAMKRTFAHLRPAIAAAVIADTPVASGSVPVCLSGHLEDVSACTTPRDRAVDDDRRDVERRAATDAGVAFIDPTDWICFSDPCPVIRGNTLIYRDRQHMTTVFSSSLAPRLDRWLSAAARR